MTARGNYYVYITTNPGRTVLYTGITDDPKRRMWEHYENRGDKKHFAERYYCYDLIYYEHYADVRQALAREKEIKAMTRKRKEALIATINPKWNTLKI